MNSSKQDEQDKYFHGIIPLEGILITEVLQDFRILFFTLSKLLANTLCLVVFCWQGDVCAFRGCTRLCLNLSHRVFSRSSSDGTAVAHTTNALPYRVAQGPVLRSGADSRLNKACCGSASYTIMIA